MHDIAAMSTFEFDSIKLIIYFVLKVYVPFP